MPPSSLSFPHIPPGRGAARFSLNSASFRLPLGEVAEAARQFGFGGLELWARDIGDRLPGDAVAKLLDEKGLGLSAFQLLRDYEGMDEATRAERLLEAEALMARMAEIGAETLLLCANTVQESSGDRPRILADLRLLADMAGQRGLRIALEPLAWSRWLNRYEEAAQCIEALDHPAMGLAVDVFHWFWGGTPIAFAQEIPMEKIFEIQLCDARPDGSPAVQMARHHRLFPGEGVWPVSELFHAFDRRGFGGFYNLEVFNDAYRALPLNSFVQRAADSIHSLLAGRGPERGVVADD